MLFIVFLLVSAQALSCPELPPDSDRCYFGASIADGVMTCHSSDYKGAMFKTVIDPYRVAKPASNDWVQVWQGEEGLEDRAICTFFHCEIADKCQFTFDDDDIEAS